MYDAGVVEELSETAEHASRAPRHRALRCKVAVAGAIPMVGILVTAAHAYAQGCSCG